MSEPVTSEGSTVRDTWVTPSGGLARRLASESYAAPAPSADLSPLEELRTTDLPGPYRRLGDPPYFTTGELLSWYSGRSLALHHVVRDDERGLVAWQPGGSEVLVGAPLDGKEMRDRPVAERITLDHEMRIRTWRGPGILRVAPTGKPWSLWYFTNEAGSFAGHYVNIELPHERPVSGEQRVHTRDLTLDLWLEHTQQGPKVWLKDEDELDAGVEGGRYTADQGATIRAIGDLARYELGHLRSWPLDEGWEDYRPPPEWDEPLSLPDLPAVLEARARG